MNVKYIIVTSILVVGGFLVGRNIFPLPTPHNNKPMVNEAQVFDATNRPYKQIEETQKDKIEAESVDDNLLSHVQNKTATSLDALKAENEHLKSELATLRSEKETFISYKKVQTRIILFYLGLRSLHLKFV